MKRLGVAVVGLGVGAQHARAYAGLPACELRWLHDHQASRARDLAAELGNGRVATNFDQLVADPEVDIVSIASFDDDHFSQVIACLRAGKHVFVEKPLCRSLSELQEIKAAWSSHNGELSLASNLVLRAAPLYRWLREQLQAKAFGNLYAFDGDYLYGRLEKITQGWRKNVIDYSVMQGGGIHLIDLLLWLTGERPSRVTATGNRICTEGTAFTYHDFVAATLEFPSGLVARITANFGCVHRHQHVLRVFGTQQTLLYDDTGPRLHTSRDPAQPAQPLNLSPVPASKGELIAPFVEAIVRGENNRDETQTVFDALSVCFACDDALQTHAPTEVTYI